MNIFDIIKNRVFIACIAMLTIFTIGYLSYKPRESVVTQLYTFPHHVPRLKQHDEQVRNGVPLVIYESWHSHDIPEGMVDNINNLLKVNPEFDYYLFSDEDCANFIESNFDREVLEAFHMLKPGAFKSDLWRYCVLYKKGGVYLDIKYYSVQPLIDLIDENQTVFVKDTGLASTDGGCFYNGFMISPPNNEIFKKCIDDIVKSCKSQLYRRNMFDITGPCLLGRILTKEYSEEYSDSVNFEYANLNGNFWNYYPGISYKGEIILKHYDNYRSEQKKTENETHYGRLYAKGDVYITKKG